MNFFTLIVTSAATIQYYIRLFSRNQELFIPEVLISFEIAALLKRQK